MSNNLAIETEGLCAAFGSRRVLYDVGLHVAEGGIYGFLGRNGAGKSTTIRLILGLLRPTVRRIRIFGREMAASGGVAGAGGSAWLVVTGTPT